MHDAADTPAPPLSPKAGAYLLGVAAIACCARLVSLAANDAAATAEHFVWLALGVVAAVFSAACAVVASLKTTLSRPSQPSSPG